MMTTSAKPRRKGKYGDFRREDGKPVGIGIKIQPSLDERLRRAAAIRDVTPSSLVREAIATYLEKTEKAESKTAA